VLQISAYLRLLRVWYILHLALHSKPAPEGYNVLSHHVGERVEHLIVLRTSVDGTCIRRRRLSDTCCYAVTHDVLHYEQADQCLRSPAHKSHIQAG
jgi:hypothetical protein